MIIKEQAMFPRPMLTEGLDDYPDGEFVFACEGRHAGEFVAFNVDIKIKQPELEGLLDTGDATLAFVLRCEETFYMHTRPITLKEPERVLCV